MLCVSLNFSALSGAARAAALLIAALAAAERHHAGLERASKGQSQAQRAREASPCSRQAGQLRL
jgi:hypothetical protein